MPSWWSGLPKSETAEGVFDTRLLVQPGQEESDSARAYYAIILLESDSNGEQHEIARKRFFVQRALPHLLPAELSWSFESGAKLHPKTPIRVELADGWKLDDSNISVRMQVVRLGRRMAGGAIEVDHVLQENSAYGGQPLSLLHEHWPHDPLVPKDHIRIMPGDETRLGDIGIEQIPSANPALTDAVRRLRGTYGDRLYDSLVEEVTAPMAIGHYEARILGHSGAILARRSFQITPPDMSNTISFTPEQEEPYDEPPSIAVAMPDGIDMEQLQHEIELHVTRNGRGGVVHFDGRARAGALSNANAEDRTFVFPQQGPWEPGRYTVSLYYAHQNLLLAQRHFELKTSKDLLDTGIRTSQPPLELEDVKVTPAREQTQVFGTDIAFTVLAAEGGTPLNTGPMIAELYFAGHYTYGCVWREGYYTGARALIDEHGKGVLSAPGEPGLHEIRVFRPTTFVTQSNATEDYSNVQVADQGRFYAGYGTELIGVAQIDVTAPAAAGIIRIDPYDRTALRSPIGVEIADPGPAFAGHTFEVQIWRSADIVPGGLRTVSLTGNGQDWRYHFKRLENELPIQRIGRFPFDASLAPLWTPGNYEVRVLDVTTGLYIDRATIRLRDPGPPKLPATAAYGENVPDDWAAANDPRRGHHIWSPPREDCVEPVFETPPRLSIVNYWPHDLDTFEDDEYRLAEQIWPGYPYFVQADFKTAPPENAYRVKVDGERRIRITRSEEDPRIYRSDVITFTTDGHVSGARP